VPTLKRVTSRDVAEQAGVSRATVSYVLNDVQDQRISPETRARVREVARRLGYTPDPAARALRNGKTDIALIANPPWILGPLVAAGLTAAVEHLECRGYAPLLAIGRAATSENLVGACQRVHPRGLIAPAAELTPRALRLIRASGTHAVLAIGSRRHKHVPTVIVDQGLFGRLAIEHLADRGHRRILAIAPASPPAELAIAEDRLAGARQAARIDGIHLSEAHVGADHTVSAAIAKALADTDPPTAVYAYNDEHAMAAIRALADQGLRVPDDVAVIGCDDIPAAQHLRPSLTTVAPDSTGLYAASADALVELMEGRKLKTPLFHLNAQVVVRESA
jgi:DNA-binding LacI/PurR family transcriptional regulator